MSGMSLLVNLTSSDMRNESAFTNQPIDTDNRSDEHGTV